MQLDAAGVNFLHVLRPGHRERDTKGNLQFVGAMSAYLADDDDRGPVWDCPTWIVGLSLQYLQLCALGEGVLQTELQKAGLRPAHPLQQRQQSHRLLALVPSLEPAG